MIPEVKNGLKITAELQNLIIEAVNGQMIPSEGQFVTTKAGPIFSSGVASTTSNPTLVPEQIFHCMYATTYTIASRSSSGTLYNMLGNSRTKAWFVSLVDRDNAMEMLQNNSPLSVADFGVLGKSASLDGKFDSAWLNRTNWLDTGYDELSAEPRFAWVVEKKEDEQPMVVYAVMHNENNVENAKQRIIQLFNLEDVDVIKNGKLAVYDNEKQTTRQMLLPTLGGEPPEVICDSEVSATLFDPTALSSIQHVSSDVGDALELFKFDDISAYENVALSSLQENEAEKPEWTLLARHYDENELTAVLKYITLSGNTTPSDVNVDTQYYNNPFQRSIDEVSSALQLYSFDNTDSDLSATYNLRFDDDTRPNPPTEAGLGHIDFIIRSRGQDGKQVSYQTGELKVPHERLDSDGIGQQSLSYKQAGLQGMPKELQLYKFDDMTTCSPLTLTRGEGIVIRRMTATDVFVDYMEASALSNFVPVAPNLSALNNLSIVTGIEYPMTGINQYKIVAHRKEMSIVNNTLVLTDLPDQTIDTIPHSQI